MSSDNVICLEGKVLDIHRGGIFEVQVKFGEEYKKILARTSGKMKKFEIKVVPGDIVTLELSPYDLTQGRIVRRAR